MLNVAWAAWREYLIAKQLTQIGTPLPADDPDQHRIPAHVWISMAPMAPPATFRSEELGHGSDCGPSIEQTLLNLDEINDKNLDVFSRTDGCADPAAAYRAKHRASPRPHRTRMRPKPRHRASAESS